IQTYRIMQWLNSVPTSQSDRLLGIIINLQKQVVALISDDFSGKNASGPFQNISLHDSLVYDSLGGLAA
ncbi:MAG: hypothetical protein O3B76_10670, partial [Proteobacteria bacterium]|nr:hypothetical protein [Pseudomonadota bacterium]MDA1023944.1 hypothetical protein [Pseudomonadota bacterium]